MSTMSIQRFHVLSSWLHRVAPEPHRIHAGIAPDMKQERRLNSALLSTSAARHAKDLKYFFIDRYPKFVIEDSGYAFRVFFFETHLKD